MSDELKGRGAKFPEVAFVGASLSVVDKIRNRPFSGIVGKTLDELYVAPLGLSPDEVYFTTIVKDHCVDSEGFSVDPTNAQIVEAWEEFSAEMSEVQPRFIVALGKTARGYLQEAAAEWVPHPRAVNMLGDSGEVNRKMLRLAKKVAEPDETISGTIIKSVDEKQIVYGVVMEPMENDTDENWTSPGEIETAAHFFMKNFRLVDSEHTRVDIDATPVESWVAHEDTVINGQPVKAGSWLMGIKVEDENEWGKVRDGDYSGFSIDAFARIDPNLVLDN